MDISKNLMSHFSRNTFNAFPDNCRTQMSYMQWFCHIRSAVIHNDHLRVLCLLNTKIFCFFHLVQIICNKCFFQSDIDKSRLYNLYLFHTCAVL